MSDTSAPRWIDPIACHYPELGTREVATNPHLAHHFDTPEQQYSSAKLGIWNTPVPSWSPLGFPGASPIVGNSGGPGILAADAADCLIVIAGMEGALPSVVGGLTGVPLVAVPTSVGYGTGAGGLAALMAMLNSCAPGIVVVNIDNGYGAGVHAARVARRIGRPA